MHDRNDDNDLDARARDRLDRPDRPDRPLGGNGDGPTLIGSATAPDVRPLVHRPGHNLDGKPLRPIRPGQQMLDLLGDGTTVVIRDFPPLAAAPVEVRMSLGVIFTLAAQQMGEQGKAIVQLHPVKRA
jgi:hypothetical protein